MLKLLQIRDLTLAKAIDICKASEVAGKQMKAIASVDLVQSLRSPKKRETCDRLREKSRVRRSRDDSREPVRAKSPGRRCKYCDRKHELLKEACPAYGKVCRHCSRKNHFEYVCQSKATGNRNLRHDVHEIDTDEQLLTLGDEDADRWYTRLKIGDKTVRFLLDCQVVDGAVVWQSTGGPPATETMMTCAINRYTTYTNVWCTHWCCKT